jgi:phosphatidyl-myo-inositol alpha-mannosyltransferase
MKKNKKLSLLISSYDDIKNPYYGGGGAIAIHELAKRLSKKHNIKILSWNHSGKKKETIDGVNYERIGFSFIPPKPAMFLFQISLPIFSMFKDYDLWMESFTPPFTTSFLPLFTKKPIIGIVHMLAAEDMQRKYKLPFHLIENIGIKKYRNIITTSKNIKEKIIKINPYCSVAIISNGINKIYDRENSRKNYILFLGRIEIEQKGLDLLIPAFKKFNTAHNNSYKLIIAGSGHPKELTKLKQIIIDCDVSKSIISTGKVTGKAKTQLLNNASCVVIPSRFETYSIVALEALAHNLPIVCFNINGLSWIPQKAAKKVHPFDINKLYEAISYIVSHPSITNTMKIKGRNYAKKFTWDSISTTYDNYITHITI